MLSATSSWLPSPVVTDTLPTMAAKFTFSRPTVLLVGKWVKSSTRAVSVLLSLVWPRNTRLPVASLLESVLMMTVRTQRSMLLGSDARNVCPSLTI